ncbi:MAG: alpha/beta fold hydrolase [Thermodesulfobacteriota bacterium]
MKAGLMIMVAGCLVCFTQTRGAVADPTEYVILLHGLARTERSMQDLASRLVAEGYGVMNAGYPSRTATVQELAEKVIPAAVAECRRNGAGKIHFVTHSMGGILVRYYLSRYPLPDLGRVVMMAPPNSGSEAVDRLKDNFAFKWLNGPAGGQLGTGGDSLPRSLGPVNFEAGVIAGDRSVNLLLSRMIPGPDDGKVSVAATRVDGMKDHIVIHATHPFIMDNRQAIDQTIVFLKQGQFSQ